MISFGEIGLNLSANDSKTVIKKVAGDSQWDAAAITAEPVTQSIKFKMIERGPNGHVAIGLSPKPGFNINGLNHTSMGTSSFELAHPFSLMLFHP